MKKICVMFMLLFVAAVYPQDTNISSGIFHSSVMAGANFADINGTSIVIEGKVAVTENINIKLSLGYSKIYKQEGYTVKTNKYEDFLGSKYYGVWQYDVQKLEYSVAPIVIGAEYFFYRSSFSFYGTFEAGYNSYDTEVLRSNNIFVGQYNTYDEVPSQYKNKEPEISDDSSFRFAPGVGVTYRLSPGIALDVRYLYNINSNLINTHQVLFGIQI